MHKYFLTIDNGGTNTKVVICDEQGHQLAAVAFPTKGLQPKPGYHELSLSDLWDKLGESTKKALAEADLTGDQISGIATVGHGKGLYVLDLNHKPFMNGILSADSRAEDLAEEFESRVHEIYPISHQHIMTSQAPVILRWLKDNQRNDYRQIGAVLSNKDYIGYLLTGEVKQEIGDASGNNFVNLDSGLYDRKLFEFFGIPEMYDQMPPLIKATDQRGVVSEQAAKKTGLVAGTPVFGGMFDIDACSIATGVLDDDKFSIIAGTWNMNIFPCDTMAPESSGLMNSIFPTGKNLVEASSPTSAGNLAIILRMLMTAETRDAEANGKSIYDTLEQFLESTDARYCQVLFYSFLYGSNSAPDAEGSFIGLRSTTTKSEMIRAVYEGIAFAHRYHIEQLMKATDKKPSVLRMSGGATNSKAWIQIFSDILKFPIEIVEATELGGLGGSIASAVGTGVYSSLEEASAKMSKVRQRFEPQFDQVKIYDEKYAQYVVFMDALKDLWKSFKKMQERIAEND